MDVIWVIAEVRNVAQIENYREGRKVFKTLRSHLEEVNQLI